MLLNVSSIYSRLFGILEATGRQLGSARRGYLSGERAESRGGAQMAGIPAGTALHHPHLAAVISRGQVL